MGSIVLVLIYLFAPMSNASILFVGFLLGFISLMKFSPMGAFMTELFPPRCAARAGLLLQFRTRHRCVLPAMVGFLAENMGLGLAIAVFAFSG